MKSATKMFAGRVVDLGRRAELLARRPAFSTAITGASVIARPDVRDVKRSVVPRFEVQLLDFGTHVDRGACVEVGQRTSKRKTWGRAPAPAPWRRLALAAGVLTGRCGRQRG
jgi:hypothetical protein